MSGEYYGLFDEEGDVEGKGLWNDAVDEPLEWPSAQALPSRALPARPSLAGLAHVAGLVLIVGVSVSGRIDPALVAVLVFAAIASVAPRVTRRDPEALLVADLATRLRAEAQQHAFDSRGWALSAWALVIGCLVAAAAAGYSHWLFADSPTPFWRAASLRWSATAATIGLLVLEAVRQFRRSRKDAQRAIAVAEELELEDAPEAGSWPSYAGTHLLAGLFALSVAAAVAYFAGPENRDDSPASVMVIGHGAKRHAAWLSEQFGLQSEGLSMEEAWGRAEFSFNGQRGELETLTHLADLEGVGFVLLELDALKVNLEERADVRVARSTGATPTFASLATGDVNVLQYARVMRVQGRSRGIWMSLGPHPVALGGAEPGMSGEEAERLAIARAFFGQPAFYFPDFDHPERPPEFNGRSQTLLRGVLYFGLDPDFWPRAIARYNAIEASNSRLQEAPR